MEKPTLLEVVKSCLQQIPETRNSDNKLLYAVYRHLGLEAHSTFEKVITMIIAGELPALASITRAKRKVVELHPELDCCLQVRTLRDAQQESYVALSKVKKI